LYFAPFLRIKIATVSLKKNLLYNFLLSASQVAFPLISIPYISRVLHPEGIGKVGFIDSLTSYFIVIAEFGIVTYGIREVSRKRDQPGELRILVSELVSLHVLTSAASAALYLLLQILLYPQVNNSLLLLISVSFLLTNALACEWYFWGTEKFKFITFRSLTTRVLGLASIFMLVKQPPDYIYYYAIIAGTAIVNLVWNFFKMRSEVGFSFRPVSWRKHIRAVLITYMISLVYSVVIMLDNVFLQMLSTSVAVAYFMMAAKVVRISGALITDTLLVFYPRTVYHAHKNEVEALQETVLYSARMIVLATIPMAAGIFLLAEKLTRVYLGETFLPLAANLKIMALYPFLKAYSLFLNKQLLMPFDRERLVLNGLLIGAVVFVLATIPLTHLWADKGTSMAIMLSELVVLIANFYYVQRLRTGLTLVDWKSMLQAVLGAALFAPIIHGVEKISPDLLLQLIVAIFFCILAYFVFLVLTGNAFVISLLRPSINFVRKPNKD
jgi:O-antigen/teichoic acid export membrane protein